MTELVVFYELLKNEQVDTIDIDGVLLASNNKGKWHACKKGATNPTHVCGSSGPSNPFRSDWSERNFKKSCEAVNPRQYLEFGRLCQNCQRIIEDEYNLTRVVSAVPTDAPPDAWKGISERFIRRASKEVDNE